MLQVQIKDNQLMICYQIKDYLKDLFKYKHKNQRGQKMNQNQLTKVN